MKPRLLFNPFVKIAGAPSLFIGLASMLLAGFIGCLSKTHFDGILNVHAGIHANWYIHLLGPVLSVLTVGIWFAVFALIFSKSKVRMIDIFGTQCFAFLPLLPASLMGFFKVVDEFGTQLQKMAQQPGQPLSFEPFMMIGFILIILFVLLFTVWSAVWIFNGYKVASNLPQKTLIPVYITGLIIGMIVPKYLLSTLF